MRNKINTYLQPGKKNITLIYILYLIGLMNPMTPFVGGVFAYANKSSHNKLWQSHYLFALKNFYIYIFWVVLSLLKNLILMGFVLYIAVFVWLIIRSMFALRFLLQDLPYPNPSTFWI